MNKQITPELKARRDEMAEKIFNFLPNCEQQVELPNEKYRHKTVFLKCESSKAEEAGITRKEIEQLISELRQTGIYVCSFSDEGMKFNLISVNERSFQNTDLKMTFTFAEEVPEKPKFGSISLKEAFEKAEAKAKAQAI